MKQTKKIVRTVNQRKPQVEFHLWHTNERGYAPKGNRETVGICKVKDILRKVLKMRADMIEPTLELIMDRGKILVFGKGFDFYFVNKVKNIDNAFLLWRVE